MDECEKKPNSCVGDVDELQIECWNCSHNWVIFRFAAEKEMSAKCPQCGMWNKRALRQALADTEIIEDYLNSPQFKKQYAKLSVVEEAFKSSIRNPHNTYIEWTKEELAELDDILATVFHNHGLEEVE